MFKAIYDLAQQTPLSLHITVVGGAMRVIVQPHVQENENVGEDGLTEPLALEGSPDELDREFATLVATFTTERSSLVKQLEATTTLLKAAKDKATQEASKATAKSNRGSSKTSKASAVTADQLPIDGESKADAEISVAGASDSEPTVVPDDDAALSLF